eukprot:Protomagalhaensia_sp_Gyna_25__1751@NODE_191_length_4537_cov_75_480658_g148_i0_p1_GENE_NODE_191_length_4537_cov_75_480658_g148_i0NODE_191_length_4537_cov_75_480658_g148_i0_p1_ORF_typecomplete_len739_score84_93XPG_I_2/PF12813_7/0_00076XPG_N/PF00752_17/0_0061XPG_N/PF00752_17/1_3e04XPG_I/PF00867_18/0_059_NODE_191_length_4537_cov_75_480658_g148_i023214450
MGVQGLWHELSNQSVEPQECSEGIVLLDYYAWFFWFLETFLPGETRTAEQFLSSDYSEIVRLIDCWLAAVIAQRLEVVFVVDGSAGTATPEAFQSKLQTWIDRRTRVYRDLDRLSAAVTDALKLKGHSSLLIEYSAPFSKVSFVVRRHLKLRNYQLFTCLGEADTVIDVISEKMPVAFVVTNDTDLMLMPHTKVLCLWDASRSPFWRSLIEETRRLERDAHAKPKFISNRTMYLRTAETTASRMGLQVIDLPALAMLGGTEHTRELPKLAANCYRLSQRARLLLSCPKVTATVRIDSEFLQLYNARDIAMIPGWTRAHRDVYNFVCRFYRAVTCKADEREQATTLKMFKGAREELSTLRRGLSTSKRFFGLKAAQKYADESSSLFEFFTKMQILDMPSVMLTIVSPNHTYFTETTLDFRLDLASIQNKPLSAFTGPCRQSLYGLLLRDQPNVKMQEMLSTQDHSSIETCPVKKPLAGLPNLLKLSALNDLERLKAFKRWLYNRSTGDTMATLGATACAISKLYTIGGAFADAVLIATMIHSTARCKGEQPKQAPQTSDRTLSRAGDYLASSDKQLFHAGTVPRVDGVSFLTNLIHYSGLKGVPRSHVCVPTTTQMGVWGRLMDYFEHVFWGQCVFLLAEEANIRIEEFFDFHLFVLVHDITALSGAMIHDVWYSSGAHEILKQHVNAIKSSTSFMAVRQQLIDYKDRLA